MNGDFLDLTLLLEQGKLSELKNKLFEMNIVDIAEFMGSLEGRKLLIVFRILPKDISADVFSYLEMEDQANIVNSITDKELATLFNNMFLDDTVSFLEEVPANVVRRVLANTDADTRSAINRLLQYPENSAGSIMTVEMVELHDRINVAQAISQIRKTGVDKETIYTCYCIDDARHLAGVLPLHRLLLSDENAIIANIMDENTLVISVNTHTDQEEVAALAKKYDLLSVPVVDNEGRLVGIITIDDIIDVIEEENTEDFERMAAISPSESDYLKTNVFTLSKNRIVWLLLLMISASLTSRIIGNFENVIAVVAGLTAAMPMLMTTGGNAGSQVSTLVIRGLSLGTISTKDYFKIIFKEIRVGLICGIILATVNLCRLMILGNDNLKINLVICSSMFFTVVVSKLVGGSLPIAAKLVRIDPALMAGPMISTMVDSITLLIYFSIAKTFLL